MDNVALDEQAPETQEAGAGENEQNTGSAKNWASGQSGDSERRQGHKWLLGGLASVALALVLALALFIGLAPRPTSGNTSLAGYHAADEPGRSGFLPSKSVQTNEAGAVTIDVTPKEIDGNLVFDVAMNTHSVELGGYDLGKLAVLRTRSGQTVVATVWEPEGSGHHVKGTLTFPSKTDDGKSLVGQGAGSLELVISGVSDVPERVFTWRQ